MVDKAAKNLKFDGTERLGFQRYKRQILVIGRMKGGFTEALEKLLTVPSSLSVHYEEIIKKRKPAWSYLDLTLDSAPLALVEKQSGDNPSVARAALCSRYEPNTVEAFTHITRKMESCTLDQPDKDPEQCQLKLD